MFTSDEQILKLPSILKADGKITGPGQFYEDTGISKQHFSNIKNQESTGKVYHFTPAQIENIATIYGINYNWIFATSDQIYNIQKVTKSVTALQNK